MDRTIPYRPDVDGLRAVAVGLVLVFHFQLLPLGKGGFLGVDVFFVISGYLITAIILKQLNNDTFKFSSFYIKRILRLAPVLFVVLLMVTVAGAIIYLPSDFRELGRQLIATQLYLSNVYFWQNVNYFGLHPEFVPLLHTWSLAVEEQFYLAFPAFLYLVYKFAKRRLWYVIGAAAIASFALNVALVAKKPELTFYLTPTRGWEFLVGSLALLLCMKSPKLPRLTGELIGLVGAVMILGSVLGYTREVKFPGYYALFPSVGAAMVILSGATGVTSISRVLALPLMVYIGRLSYSLYLVHWPVHVFALYVLDDDYTLPWRFCMLGLTAVVSILLLHFVEDPVRKGNFGVRPLRVYAPYFGGLAASVVLFSSIVFFKGMPQRFDDETVRMASFSEDKPALMEECHFKDKPVYETGDFCVIGAKDKPATWLVYGDSHAWAAIGAFDQWLRKKNESGLFMFRYACPPLAEIDMFGDKGDCRKFNRLVLDYLSKSAKVDNVVLVSTWVYGRDGIVTDNPDEQSDRLESSALFKDSFGQTLQMLQKGGKSIYLWEPVPGAKSHVPMALAKSSDPDKTARKISYTLQEHLENHRYFYELISGRDSRAYKLFSPAHALCTNRSYCAIVIDGKPVYYDGSHLSQSLQDYWAGVLAAQEVEQPAVWRHPDITSTPRVISNHLP